MIMWQNRIGMPKGTVTCPGCNQPMVVIERKAIQFSNRMDAVTYRCESCKTETIRTIKAD